MIKVRYFHPKDTSLDTEENRRRKRLVSRVLVAAELYVIPELRVG